MTRPKIITVVGARPQFIKAAVLSHAIRRRFKEIVVHTGQHYDYEMSQNLFRELHIPKPNYNLGVRVSNREKQVEKMLLGIEKLLIKEKPQLVMVYGDTNSTLAGALATAKLNIPLVHVEAGLRSFNLTMPEEVNRVIVDRISEFLFCPTSTSVANLKREGITRNVFLVGDVMNDSIWSYLPMARKKSKILPKLKLEPKKYYLLTIHRAGNTTNIKNLKNILKHIDDLDVPTVFPIHPRTKKFLKSSFKPRKKIILIPPISYLDMLILEENAKMIFTDSGGIQKEAYILKVPCITIRNETEWVETLKGGCNRLSNIKAGTFSRVYRHAIESKPRFNSCPYGKGNAAEKITEVLSKRVRGQRG